MRFSTPLLVVSLLADWSAVALADAATNQPRPAHRELVFASDWALDLHNRDVYTLAPNGRERVNRSKSPAVSESAAALSPDGTTIAFTTSGGGIFTMPASGGEPRRVVPDGAIFDPSVYPPRWTASGELGFFGTVDRRSGVFVVDLRGGSPRLVLTNATSPAWSPDGRRLAFVRKEEGGAGPTVRGPTCTSPTRTAATSDGLLLMRGCPEITPRGGSCNRPGRPTACGLRMHRASSDPCSVSSARRNRWSFAWSASTAPETRGC